MGSTNELKVYAEYLMECELAARTQEIYLQEAEKLEKYLQNDTITKKKLLGYKELLEASGYAITTLNQRIIAANRYLRYLGYEDCALKTNRLQSRQSLNHMLTKKEYQILLDYAKESGREKYYALMRTLAMTGIRIGELKFFTVEILEKRVIQVTGKKKTREIYLPDKLIQELKTYCSHAGIEGGVIFQGRAGEPIHRVTVYNMLVRLADMTGIPKEKVHPHNFRHLFALTYMENYSNLFELADLLGHSSLETTRIYARSTMEKKRQRMDKLGL